MINLAALSSPFSPYGSNAGLFKLMVVRLDYKTANSLLTQVVGDEQLSLLEKCHIAVNLHAAKTDDQVELVRQMIF